MSARGSWIALVLLIGCKQTDPLERRVASFEVTIQTPVGAPERRCLLPGSSTAGVDVSGCPFYERDSAGNTIARVEFVARAIDNFGELHEGYNSVAAVKVFPGKVEPAFRQVRFMNGVAEGVGGNLPSAAFSAAFGDTYLWVVDEAAPPRSSEVVGLGTPCGSDDPAVCDTFGELGCINVKPIDAFDPQGLAYCSMPCDDPEGGTGCPDGYRCAEGVRSLPAAFDAGDTACVRVQPTYAVGAAGPIHLVEPNLADVNRADSLITSPFIEDFVDIKRGNLVVTAVRIDGFYLTDTCPLRGYTSDGQEACGQEERDQLPEFNHLFVFNFSRPDDLFAGDRLLSVSGPMTEFNGLTELAFPLWEVDYARSPQPIPEPIDLSERVAEHYPALVQTGGRCLNVNMNPDRALLIQCDFAMERVEAARVMVNVRATLPIAPGSAEERNYDRFGQWPVQVDDGTQMGRTFQLITRENLPFFDPRAFGAQAINQTVIGNLRQVAFDDRSEPIWIIEPRDQADCPWCVNP